MNLEWLDNPLTIAGFALIVYLALISMALRLCGQRHALLLLVACAAIVMFFTTMWFGQRVESAAMWRFAAFFACGVAIVIFVYGAVLKSLSLQMLAYIAARPDREASLNELTAAIIAPSLDERIALLESSGLIESSDGSYIASKTGRSVADRISRIRLMLRIDASGLYSG